MRTPKYRKHSSRDLGFVECQGKRTMLPGRYNSAQSRAAYHAFCLNLEKARSEPLSPIPVSGSGLLVNEAIGAFLDHEFTADEKQTKTGTYGNARHVLVNFLSEQYGHLMVEEFTPRKLDEFIGFLKQQPRRNRKGLPYSDGRTLTRNYINLAIFYVQKLFRWLVRKELAPASLAHALSSVTWLSYGEAREPEARDAVDPASFWRTIEFVNHQVRGLMLLQWYTGCRPGSACQATRAQFDTTATPWIWKPRHKNEWRGQDLTIFIGPKCRKLLADYFVDRGLNEFLFSPQRAPRTNCQHRARYSTGSYGQAIKYAIAKANEKAASSEQPAEAVGHWTPHMIRYQKGQAVQGQFGIEAVKATLGHESIRTSEHYAGRHDLLAKQVAEEAG